jgi:hypothetical protein
VHVDEAGGEGEAVEIDDLGGRSRCQLARWRHGVDAVAGDGDVGRPGRAARPVEQAGVAQQQVHRTLRSVARP